ncbi:retrotransposon protein, putative, ty3-gypsy subclass [Tanacetum coccineum]
MSTDGITMDPARVEAITKWPRPTTVIEVRSFLGLAGYYRRFVEGFSLLGLPLTKLMWKGEKFVWNEEREKRFKELKRRLVFFPVLTLPSGTSGYQIYSDASKKDALSRKNYEIMACLKIQPEIIKCLERMEVELCVCGYECYMANLKIEPNLILWIKEAHKEDGELWSLLENLKEAVLTEAHSSPFSIHYGSTKMYRELKHNLRWNSMIHDVARFVAKCLTCQQVKIEHQRASGLLQPLDIPTWKWDQISMDFVMGLRHAFKKIDANNHNEVGELDIEGPELIEVANEKVTIAKEKLTEARSLQKSYADRHRRALEFKHGDHVFLKVSPRERGYNYHPYHVVQYPFDKIREDLSFAEEPEAILDRQERVTRKKTIPLVKVL